MLITDTPGPHTKTNNPTGKLRIYLCKEQLHLGAKMRPGQKLLSHSWKAPQVTRKDQLPALKRGDYFDWAHWSLAFRVYPWTGSEWKCPWYCEPGRATVRI